MKLINRLALAALATLAFSGAVQAQQQFDPGGKARVTVYPNPGATPIPVTGSISASLAGFTPTAGAVANISDVVNTSQDVTLPAGADIVVTNKGAVDVFLRMQAGAGTALATDMPLKAGAAAGLHVTTQTHLSVIAPTGTGTGATAGQVNIQGGVGLASGYGGSSASSGSGGAVTNAGTFAVQLTGATNNINNVSGTISLPTGAATSAKQPALGTAGSSSTDVLSVQGIAGGTPQTINQTQINGVTASTGAGAVGTGSPRVAVGQDTTTVAGAAPTTTGIYVTGPSAAALATAALQPTNAAQGSTTSGQTGPLVQGAVTTAAPTYTTAQTAPLSLTTGGGLRTADAALLAAAQAGTTTTGSAAPASAVYMGANSGGNLTGVIQASASVPINISTATTTQLVALSGTTKIYVTGWDVIAAGTGNITLEYGTGSTCGTGTTVLTGAYNLTAQAGIARGNGLGPVLVVPAGNALCALTSAAVPMSGALAYTQF